MQFSVQGNKNIPIVAARTRSFIFLFRFSLNSKNPVPYSPSLPSLSSSPLAAPAVQNQLGRVAAGQDAPRSCARGFWGGFHHHHRHHHHRRHIPVSFLASSSRFGPTKGTQMRAAALQATGPAQAGVKTKRPCVRGYVTVFIFFFCFLILLGEEKKKLQEEPFGLIF